MPGPLQRLRQRLATSTPTAHTAQVGESGRQQRGGIVVSDDHSPDLSGLKGVREFDRMWRSDGDARKAITMVMNPILSATWDVIPYGGEDATDEDRKVAEYTHWALLTHMAWLSYLATALRVSFRSGHAPFEKTWELVDHDGRKLWAPRLDIRLPKSVYFFDQDEATGDLTAIRQFRSRHGLVPIDAEDLVLHRVGEEGDNWRGESLLRSAYKHFAYKEKLELIDVMGHERFAMGIPIAYPPTGAQPEQLAELEEILAAIRANEQSYIVSPWPAAEFMRGADSAQGAHFTILTPDKPHDLQGSLKYHSDRIAGSVLQEFMRLGQSGVGARATADVQQDPFLAYCEVLCSLTVEDPINRDLIPHFVRLNYGHERFPTLAASVIDKTSLVELADALGKLVLAEVIHPDPILEDWLREHGQLPPADPEARKAREEMEVAGRDALLKAGATDPSVDPNADPGQDPAPAGDKPGQKLSLGRSDRPLRAWESLMQLDRIEGAIDQARDRMIMACATITHQLAVAMADGTYKPAMADRLEAAIEDQLHGLFFTGVDTVQRELQAQAPASSVYGLAVDGGPVEPPPELLLRARLSVTRITQDMLLSVRRAILARGKDDQAAVQEATEAAARGALRAEALEHAAPALNLGRRLEADRQSSRIKGARYTSILDGRRCQPCATADDDVLRPLDDPLRLARIPPNPGCLGGGKCRCMEFFELMDESSPSA